MSVAAVQKAFPSAVERSLESTQLDAFHRADRSVMEDCYRQHFATVERAVGAVLIGADKETVVQEVFLRLLSSESTRRSFTGGSLGGWLTTIGRNLAIDHWRRRRREQSESEGEPGRQEVASSAEAAATEARMLIDRFRTEKLPKEWARVFEARFIRQMTQREAASELGMFRTTLAYQELRIRRLLNEFFLGDRR
jgi:RNA polymerase sigma-70 factor, ECF subfamily